MAFFYIFCYILSMPTNRTDFRSRLDKVQSIISRGCLYHATWESLWPIDKEIRVLINFRDFFDPVRGALFEGILYNFERALSSNTSEDSLPNLLSMAINEPDNLMPYSKIKDIESMSSQIAQDQRTLENLQLMRRQHLVHLEALPSEDNSIRKSDVDNLVYGVKMTFSKLFYSHHWTNPRWSPRPLRSTKLTSALIAFLWDELKKRNF